MKSDLFTSDEAKYVKWQGIKNCDTKKVSGGYLWLQFDKDCTLISVNPNVVKAEPHGYKAGQKIGFTVRNVSTRKEAIKSFELDYQIVH
jgi:hypothetical protein